MSSKVFFASIYTGDVFYYICTEPHHTPDISQVSPEPALLYYKNTWSFQHTPWRQFWFFKSLKSKVFTSFLGRSGPACSLQPVYCHILKRGVGESLQQFYNLCLLYHTVGIPTSLQLIRWAPAATVAVCGYGLISARTSDWPPSDYRTKQIMCKITIDWIMCTDLLGRQYRGLSRCGLGLSSGI